MKLMKLLTKIDKIWCKYWKIYLYHTNGWKQHLFLYHTSVRFWYQFLSDRPKHPLDDVSDIDKSLKNTLKSICRPIVQKAYKMSGRLLTIDNYKVMKHRPIVQSLLLTIWLKKILT